MGWLRQLQRWIRRLFTKSRKQHAPTILKRWYGKNCAVLRLERTTAGGIATYRVVSIYGRDYLITLDYLPDLHGEVVGEFNGIIIKLGSLDYPSNPATHRFAVFRLGSNGSSCPVGVWDVDLEGFTPKYSLRELAPRRAVAGVALQCLKIPNSSKTPSLSWESQMGRVDWLGLLEEKIRAELSNPNHSLRACVITGGNLA
ncbi:hypothetical protein I8748_32105 [Nostoc sp. CENA67]|uniref:Uncharacterized protein n=1 Tax=Amazonocrinis nigriterrae CENA67 TaxID=2794033 RepID=A0A8J7HVG7_9NOST|nr:hypothetical protein [Amazonocrinis nigriterrae]MBH8566743.1 hypothetical protein [Amazonocrinis nigriterrae CENA67]